MKAQLPFHLLLTFGPVLLFAELTTRVTFPPETEPHERTYMCWPTADIWGTKLLSSIHDDLARIGEAIVDFEPVTFLVSPNQYNEARDVLDPRIEILQIPVNDLWARDTMPLFTIHQELDESKNVVKQDLVGLDLNFSGWGEKQHPHDADSAISAKVLEYIGVKRQKATFTAESGSFETDGEGTLLVTESSIINPNRNPGKSKAQIEAELKSSLGVEKIIWFKGVMGEDITDAHVDSIARFVSPGRVIVTRPHKTKGDDDIWARASNEALKVLKESTDAKGRPFEIIEMYEPDRDLIEMVGNPDNFVTAYVNFYICNGAVIMPAFGDQAADDAAATIIRNEFPDREVVPVKITTLSSGGGGIHCATHEIPF